eukprot:209337_1
MLNDSILQWIHKGIDGDCNEYDTCTAGVLLITSLKSKYAYRLNQIHAKCLKTEIMSTRRLYYDNREQTVHKEDFLFYVRKMFEHKRQVCLIFYCGESDENGNWIINDDETDNVTLTDISICAQYKDTKSNLIIVSDCNQSGNWITLKQNYWHTKFKNIYGIQASSKPNEACNVGTFTSKYAKCCFEYSKKSKDKAIISKMTGYGISALGSLTVGTLYDGVVKQPYHKTTKKSQPTSTHETGLNITVIGHSDKYHVSMIFYNSWYGMDINITGNSGLTIGSAGYFGLY